MASPSRWRLIGQLCLNGRLRLRMFVILLGVLLLFAIYRIGYVKFMPVFRGSMEECGAEVPERRLPQCIIIGVRKGGTRALIEFLNLHPHVNPAHHEIHFFDNDDNYRRGLEWYRSKLPPSSGRDLTIEKTPRYFITPLAPRRIHHMNSSIKILLIVREPVVRMVSDYTQIYDKMAETNATYPPFEELAIYPKSGRVNIYYRALQISLYYQHWIRWQRYFNRTQLHIVDGDMLLEQPLAELKKVERFLGLQPYLSEDNFYFNGTKGFYCLKNQTMSKCLGSGKGRRHPAVNKKVMEKLKTFLKPYNEMFFNMSGVRFDWNS